MSSFFPLHTLCLALGTFTAGAILTICLGKTLKRFSAFLGHLTGIAGSIMLILGGIFGFSQNEETLHVLSGAFPFVSIEFRVNPFASSFILLFGLIGFIVSIYAIGYVKSYQGRKSVPQLVCGTQLFMASMASVLLAANVFTFLLSWEIMSILSFLLVMFEDEDREVQNAGFVYVAMTHVGTGCLTIAFFLLSHYSGSFEFTQMHGVQMPQGVQYLVFILMFIGFATKAGLIPLHIWLPRAHPVAPSHISALMSGIMIKTAVYGFALFAFQFLASKPLWWGILVAVAGAITAVIGAVYTLCETNLKRILAYSSVENIGLIFLGLGASLILMSEHQPILSAITLLASLVHLANHAIFKSLLFLGAGSVLHATHEKDLDLLGGLIRSMPLTALFMLIGSMAISSLPPTNGFIGEWMLFESLFGLGFSSTSIMMHLFGILLVATLTLTAALAAMAFVRMFSMTFLALPRRNLPIEVHEVGTAMKTGMGLLAALCIILGMAPGFCLRMLGKSVSSLLGQTVVSYPLWRGFSIVSNPHTHLAVVPVTVAIVLCMGIAYLIARTIGGNKAIVSSETWACGNTLTPQMTYTASGFSKPIRILFRPLLRQTRKLEMAHYGSPHFPMRYMYVSQVHAVAEKYMYMPLLRIILKGAAVVRTIQNGHVQSYLAYMFLALVVVLILVK